MNISVGQFWGRVVPSEHHSNFNHLILDIAWFGILNGSAIAYISVYAARLGASTLQIGLIAAGPALMTLIMALPAGRWLQRKPITRGVFLSSILHRWFYLLWVFLPLVLVPQQQVWAIILIILLMSIPGTALAVGFNAMFASVVPSEWRADVVGKRNAAFALASVLTTLFCGWLLARFPFPQGYQIVFAVGFLGAAMSSLHLYYIRLHLDSGESSGTGRRIRDWAQPGSVQIWHNLRTTIGLNSFIQRVRNHRLNLRSIGNYNRFGIILFLVFLIHLTLFLANPLFPIYLVQEVRFSDQDIGLGNSVFYMALFLGSTRLGKISGRFGHQRTLALGMLLTALYPGLIALTQELWLFLLASIAGGLAWSLAGGALGNFILEKIPEEESSIYLAWYNIALKSGVLLGALLGPFLADWLGIVMALFLAGGSRFVSGYLLWRIRFRSNLPLQSKAQN